MSPRVDRWIYAFAFITFVARPLLAQTPTVHVVDRTTLGGYIEDLEIVRSGPLANQMIAVEDTALYAMRLDQPNAPLRLVADLRHLPLVTINPRGIAWVESEHSFALMQTGQLQSLVFTDETGADLGSREIHYLNGYVPNHAEGLAYIPNGAPRFADDLVTVTWDPPGNSSRLQVMQRNGDVVAEIFPALGDGVMTTVSYARPDRLLVAFQHNDTGANEMYEIDFDGHVTAGPIPTAEFTEGLARTPDGRTWITTFDHVDAYDRAFTLRAGDTRDFGVGLRLANPWGVTWFADLGEHLVNVWRGAVMTGDFLGSQARDIAAIPAAADTYSIVASPGTDAAHLVHLPRALATIGDEHRFVVASRGNQAFDRGLVVYESTGAFVERVLLPSNIGGPLGQPNSVEYIPTTHQFAVRFTQQTSRIFFFDRHGVFVRSIDLAPTGATSAGVFAFFNPDHPSGGELLAISGGQATIVDLNGALIATFDVREALDLASVADVATVSTDAGGGTFSAVDTETGELVTFTLQLP